MKILPHLQQLNYFSLRGAEGHSLCCPHPALPTALCNQHRQHIPHQVHPATQLLKVDKLLVLSADNNSSWLIFKALELYNVCSLCCKELQKIDTLLNTKKQNYCSWSGCVRVVWASEHMRRKRKIEGTVQGAWSVTWLRTAQGPVRTSLQSNHGHPHRGVTARNQGQLECSAWEIILFGPLW